MVDGRLSSKPPTHPSAWYASSPLGLWRSMSYRTRTLMECKARYLVIAACLALYCFIALNAPRTGQRAALTFARQNAGSSLTSFASGDIRLPPPPLIQRTIVPNLHIALQDVLNETQPQVITVLDCRDARWATVWPLATDDVVVDCVVCVDFAGAANGGGEVKVGAPQPGASSSPPPWLQHQSVQHVNQVPRAGSAAAAALPGAVAEPTKADHQAKTSPHDTPRVFLALSSADGQSVPVHYLPYMASTSSAEPTRFIMVDGGNMHNKATNVKKPRPPGFRVMETSADTAFSHPLRVFSLAMNTVQPTFSEVYKTQKWGSAGGGSGGGSTMDATVSVRASLSDVIAKYKIKSFLDSSCGSMHWMPLVARAAHEADPAFRYTGTDAVCSLVDDHRLIFANESAWMDFACVDASHEPLPAGYDLVFSRDSLQHLPIASAYKFLHNVRASGAKYLLVGSYLTGGESASGGRNADIAVGDTYDIDLLKPPFNLRPPPLKVIKEETSLESKFMLLIDVRGMAWDEDLGLA